MSEQRKRILVQTVGTGGPENPVWEALAFTVRERRPDLIVHCCSEKTQRETIPRFEALFKPSELPDRRTETCLDKEADDVDQLTKRYSALIERLQGEFTDPLIEVDFTSGTKPMSAAAVAASIARDVPTLHYAVGRRDATGRVMRTESLHTLSTETLIARHRLDELGRLFNLGQFTAVSRQAGQLKDRLADPLLRARAVTLEFYSQIYELWDRFEWPKAFGEIRKHDRHADAIKCAGWNDERLVEQLRHLKRCKSEPWSIERLADLFANAQRCHEQGRFDDAVSRLYRLTEYALQRNFRCRVPNANKENPTKGVSLALLKDLAPRLAEQLANRVPGVEEQVPLVEEQVSGAEKKDLGLRHTMAALAEMGDPLGMALHEIYEPPDSTQPKKKGQLGALLDDRNNSFLAHGSKPIAEERSAELSNLISAHLRQHCEGFEDACAVATFLRCPWVT